MNFVDLTADSDSEWSEDEEGQENTMEEVVCVEECPVCLVFNPEPAFRYFFLCGHGFCNTCCGDIAIRGQGCPLCREPLYPTIAARVAQVPVDDEDEDEVEIDADGYVVDNPALDDFSSDDSSVEFIP